jgi:hypothetical protein
MRICFTRTLLLVGALGAFFTATASAKPVETVSTSRATCPHGTKTVWHVAYETFGAATFHNLNGAVTHQASPGAGQPTAGLRAALAGSANQFGAHSSCTVGLRFDIYWAKNRTLSVHQEPYSRLQAALLPLPTPVGGGPLSAPQFYSRYDSVMEQFTANKANGQPLLGYDFQGETYGYVSLIDDATPTGGLISQELLQGMVRFYTTRGVRIAPNPETGMDAYCAALRRLHYTDIHRVSSSTCISQQYVNDVIAGTVPTYHGITHAAWRDNSVSRAWRLHHTLPAGLPIGHGEISSGA